MPTLQSMANPAVCNSPQSFKITSLCQESLHFLLPIITSTSLLASSACPRRRRNLSPPEASSAVDDLVPWCLPIQEKRRSRKRGTGRGLGRGSTLADRARYLRRPYGLRRGRAVALRPLDEVVARLGGWGEVGEQGRPRRDGGGNFFC